MLQLNLVTHRDIIKITFGNKILLVKNSIILINFSYNPIFFRADACQRKRLFGY